MVKGLLVGLKCEIAKLEGPMCNFSELEMAGVFHSSKCRWKLGEEKRRRRKTHARFLELESK